MEIVKAACGYCREGFGHVEGCPQVIDDIQAEWLADDIRAHRDGRPPVKFRDCPKCHGRMVEGFFCLNEGCLHVLERGE